MRTRGSIKQSQTFYKEAGYSPDINLAPESSADDLHKEESLTQGRKGAKDSNFVISIPKTHHNKATAEKEEPLANREMVPKPLQSKRPRDHDEDSDASTGPSRKKGGSNRNKGATQTTGAKPNNKRLQPPKHIGKEFLEPSGIPGSEVGTVYIQIAKSEPYVFAFDKSVLARHSPWFAKEFETPTDHTDQKVGRAFAKQVGYEFRFELLLDETRALSWILKKSSFTFPPMSVDTESLSVAQSSNNGQKNQVARGRRLQAKNAPRGFPQEDGASDHPDADNTFSEFKRTTHPRTENGGDLRVGEISAAYMATPPSSSPESAAALDHTVAQVIKNEEHSAEDDMTAPVHPTVSPRPSRLPQSGLSPKYVSNAPMGPENSSQHVNGQFEQNNTSFAEPASSQMEAKTPHLTSPPFNRAEVNVAQEKQPQSITTVAGDATYPEPSLPAPAMSALPAPATLDRVNSEGKNTFSSEHSSGLFSPTTSTGDSSQQSSWDDTRPGSCPKYSTYKALDHIEQSSGQQHVPYDVPEGPRLGQAASMQYTPPGAHGPTSASQNILKSTNGIIPTSSAAIKLGTPPQSISPAKEEMHRETNANGSLSEELRMVTTPPKSNRGKTLSTPPLETQPDSYIKPLSSKGKPSIILKLDTGRDGNRKSSAPAAFPTTVETSVVKSPELVAPREALVEPRKPRDVEMVTDPATTAVIPPRIPITSTSQNRSTSGKKASIQTPVVIDDDDQTNLIIVDDSIPEEFTRCGVPLKICEAYRNFFLLMHNMPLSIAATGIDDAFEKVSEIVTIATDYRALPAVRDRLNNFLQNYGRSMYRSILRDPPRWLKLSISLRCDPIFTEAMIHIIGQYPSWPWKSVEEEQFADKIRSLIKQKAIHLQNMIAEVNFGLFKCTLNIRGHDLTLSNINETTYGVWFVVQIWRDWFCSLLSATSSGKEKFGTIYRLMDKGNDAYLKHVAVHNALLMIKGQDFTTTDMNEFYDELGRIKEHAQTLVTPLVANYSMLDIDSECIEHLTCTIIFREDYPWKNTHNK